MFVIVEKKNPENATNKSTFNGHNVTLELSNEGNSVNFNNIPVKHLRDTGLNCTFIEESFCWIKNMKILFANQKTKLTLQYSEE